MVLSRRKQPPRFAASSPVSSSHAAQTTALPVVVKVLAEDVGWSLFPREDGLFDQHHDEKTGLKWVCRGESIYPPCSIGAPAAFSGSGGATLAPAAA